MSGVNHYGHPTHFFFFLTDQLFAVKVLKCFEDEEYE